MSDVMTLREVAAFLKVHPNTIYRLARSGKMPAFKMGTDWRFHRGAVERWARASASAARSDRRDELLHLIHWMVSQGFSLTLTETELATLLDWPPRRVKRELRALAEDGLLSSEAGRVSLTPEGLAEAARRYKRSRRLPLGHESVATFAERFITS